MNIPDLLHTIVAFLVAISILIFFHELGHFIVARLCGVKVLRFSLGFGKTLFMRRFGKDQTEWAISAIPFGGYVKMLGEQDDQENKVDETEAHRAFYRQSVGKRSLIVAAGPVANLLLAIFFFWLLFVVGTQELRPLLGAPVAESPAAVAGITDGDRVVSVDETSIQTWADLHWILIEKAATADKVDLHIVTTDGMQKTSRLDLGKIRANGWEAKGFEKIGLTLYEPVIPAVIGEVLADGAGETAGFRPGDVIKGIDAAPIKDWPDFTKTVRNSPDKPLQVSIERDGQPLSLKLVPRPEKVKGKTVGLVNMKVADSEKILDKVFTTVHYGPLSALNKAFSKTVDTSVFTLRMFGKMITGEASTKNISGPITIADLAGQSAKMGWTYFVNLLAMVSLGLGILNLLPIPILDGGHLLYHAIEFIKRGPITESMRIVGQQIGLAFLVALMFLAFYNDINRLVFQ